MQFSFMSPILDMRNAKPQNSLFCNPFDDHCTCATAAAVCDNDIADCFSKSSTQSLTFEWLIQFCYIIRLATTGFCQCSQFSGLFREREWGPHGGL